MESKGKPSEESQGDSNGPRRRFRDHLVREELLPTISLINVPHPRIPNLFQRCFEYVEPWQWSPATERVETGHWFFAPQSKPRPNPSRETEGADIPESEPRP